MTTAIRFSIRYAGSNLTEPIVVEFCGSAAELASSALRAAFDRLGREDAGELGFFLSPADVLNKNSGVTDTQFLELNGDETLGDLRRIIGPDDSVVLLRSGGWGGTDLPEMFRWAVEDLLPAGRAILEAYGAVEAMRMVGRIIESRRNRETREDADYWVRGDEAPPERLIEAVLRHNCWEVDSVERAFGLTRAEGSRLMSACGYQYDPATKAYYLLDAYPGLFESV